MSTNQQNTLRGTAASQHNPFVQGAFPFSTSSTLPTPTGGHTISLNSPPATAIPLPTMADQPQTPEQQALAIMLQQMLDNELTPLRQQLVEKDAAYHDLQQKFAMHQTWTSEQLNLAAKRVEDLEKRPAGAGQPTPAVKVQPPEAFYGDRNGFRAWLSQLNLFFSLSYNTIRDDRARVLYACSYIKGPAYAYVEATVDSAVTGPAAEELNNYDMFIQRLQLVFGPIDQKAQAQRELQTLKQKKSWSVEQYAAEFKRWQLLAGWNEDALIHHFKEGLQEHVRVLMVPLEPQPSTVDEYMKAASRMDARYRSAKHISTSDATIHAVPTSTTPARDPDAMDLSRMTLPQLQAKVPKEEWERRLKLRLCLNCAKGRHRWYDCKSTFSPNQPTPPPQRQSRVATATMSASPGPSSAPSPSTSPAGGAASQESISRMITLMEGMLQAKTAAAEEAKPQGF